MIVISSPLASCSGVNQADMFLICPRRHTFISLKFTWDAHGGIQASGDWPVSWLMLVPVVCGCGCGLDIGSVGGGEHWHQETFPSEIDVEVMCDLPGFVLCLGQ